MKSSVIKDTKKGRDIVPFPGLRAFTPEDSSFFFRDPEFVKSTTNTLIDKKLLMLTGPSGSGKTSLVNAGIIPLLNRQGGWIIISMVPGNDPLPNLYTSIRDALNPAAPDFDKGKSFPDQVITLLENNSGKSSDKILLFIDQWEDLFRFQNFSKAGEVERIRKEASDFLSAVLLTDQIPVWLALTMNIDFLKEMNRYPSTLRLLNGRHILMPAPGDNELVMAMEEPVKLAGASISSKLVEHLVKELKEVEQKLPALQFTMWLTWENWKANNPEGRTISHTDLEAAGGLKDSTAKYLDSIYLNLSKTQRPICEKIFKSLTELGSSGEILKRRMKISLLSQIVLAPVDTIIDVINHFRSEQISFILPGWETDLSAETVVELSHESIANLWKRLDLWTREERESVEIYQKLAYDASRYQVGKTSLLTPPELDRAISWKMKNRPNLAWAERYDPAYERTLVYLNTSEQEFEQSKAVKERKRKLNLLRTRVLASIFSVAMAMFLFLYFKADTRSDEFQAAFIQSENLRTLAEQQAAEAIEKQKLAEQIADEALEQQSSSDNVAKLAELRRLRAEQKAQEEATRAALAQQNLAAANTEKVAAIQNQEEADQQRKEAERARMAEFTRRVLSTSESMSIKSLQINSDPELKALLALQAFRFNEQYEGNNFTPEVYTSLYESVKSLLGDDYNYYKGHTNVVRAVSFLPRTSSFFSAGSDGRILKWNLNTSTTDFAVMASGRNVIDQLEVSSDGRWLLAAENRNGLLVINLESNNPVAELFSGREKNIRSITIASDNNTVYTAGLENYIEVWNLLGRSSRILTETESRINALSVSPDGSILAGGTRDGKLMIWRVRGDMASNSVFDNNGNAIQTVKFSPNGRYLAAGDVRGNLMIFRADNFEILRILQGHEARITDVEFSEDSRYLTSTSYDGKVFYWNTGNFSLKPIELSDNEGFVFASSYSTDGRFVVTCSAEEPRLVVRPAASSIIAESICRLVSRNMTQEEWNDFVGGDIEYLRTCQNK